MSKAFRAGNDQTNVQMKIQDNDSQNSQGLGFFFSILDMQVNFVVVIEMQFTHSKMHCF